MFRDKLQLSLVQTVFIEHIVGNTVNLDGKRVDVIEMGSDCDAVTRGANVWIIEIHVLALDVGDGVFHLGTIDGIGETFQILLQRLVLFLLVFPGHLFQQIATVLIVVVALVCGIAVSLAGRDDGKDVGGSITLGCGEPVCRDALGKGAVIIFGTLRHFQAFHQQELVQGGDVGGA